MTHLREAALHLPIEVFPMILSYIEAMLVECAALL